MRSNGKIARPEKFIIIQTLVRNLRFFQDDGRMGSYSKILYFNSAMMAIPCYTQEGQGMTFIQRAKPQFREIEGRHLGIPQSEFTNA